MSDTFWAGYSITALMEHHALQRSLLLKQSSIPMSEEVDVEKNMQTLSSRANRKERRREGKRLGKEILPLNKPYVRETPKKKPWKNQ